MRPKPFTRVCCVCKNKQNKFNMFRLCKTKNGFELDKNFSNSGKGNYVCKQCAEHLLQNRGLNKAFRTNVSNEIYYQIINQLKES